MCKVIGIRHSPNIFTVNTFALFLDSIVPKFTPTMMLKKKKINDKSSERKDRRQKDSGKLRTDPDYPMQNGIMSQIHRSINSDVLANATNPFPSGQK